jgi:nicotinate-nucleotide adenylyltransferase
VVYPRHGSDILPDSLPTCVTLAATPLLNVSSTDIRQRVRNGAPLRPFVPEPIIPLVRRLYR